jgi:hypothetical protein
VSFGKGVSRGEKSDVVLSADIALYAQNADVRVFINVTLNAADDGWSASRLC